MDREQIVIRRKELIDRYGSWTAHNFRLSEDLYTFTKDQENFDLNLLNHALHLQRILQIVCDVIEKPVADLRVLDLACLEGLYGLEFAMRGAEVVAVEAREANIEKARFAGEALDLNNISFVQDDVRNLSVGKYGEFDVVLCLGILYHLTVPDVFLFTERMFEVCKQLTIVDTHVGLESNVVHRYKDRDYFGWTFREHAAASSPEDRLKQLWASLDNETSFWFTRPSIYNLFSSTGFTTVYSCNVPALPSQGGDRDTLVAMKGKKTQLRTSSILNDQSLLSWPETSLVRVHSGPESRVGPLRKLRRLAGRIVR